MSSTTLTKMPGSKGSRPVEAKRNPSGYQHERKSKNGRKHPTKANKGGKMRSGGWGHRNFG